MIPRAAFGDPRAAQEDSWRQNGSPEADHPEPGGVPRHVVIRTFEPPDHVNTEVKRRFALVAFHWGP